MIDQKRLTAESFDLARSLSEVYNAKTRIDVILNSVNVRFQTRDMMKRWSRNLGSVLNEFQRILPTVWADVFAKELLNDEDTQQIDQCITLMMQLPKGIKDEIENYIEGRHAIYGSSTDNKGS